MRITLLLLIILFGTLKAACPKPDTVFDISLSRPDSDALISVLSIVRTEQKDHQIINIEFPAKDKIEIVIQRTTKEGKVALHPSRTSYCFAKNGNKWETESKVIIPHRDWAYDK